MAKQFEIKITSAVSIEGEIVAPDEVVTVDESLAKNLLRRGKAEVATDDVDPADKPLGKMTVAELKEYAEKLEIEGAAGMNKAKLIAAIEEAENE